MPRARTPKPAVVALKLDAETAAFLDTLPNKSEFIRASVRARLDLLCPLCGGTGQRPPAPLQRPGGRHLHALPRARCGDCGRESQVVGEVDTAAADRGALVQEIARLRTFLAYGDYFCAGCYGRSQPCQRCGHRVSGREPSRSAHACGA